MGTETYRALFYNSVEQTAKSFGMKYSKNAFCAYQRLGDMFWSANFLCGFFLVDGQLEVAVENRLKPCAFDVLQFSIIDAERPRRVTDPQRVRHLPLNPW